MQLRPFQERALKILGAQSAHLICQSPTGSGKSLIFEKMAQKPGNKMLLVTPLIALGLQQEKKLKSLGLKVSFRSGPPSENTSVWIVSPETLFRGAFLSAARILKRWRPDLLVVDECHCFWDWGESFRPEFFWIPSLVTKFEISHSLWLTATLSLDAKERLRAVLPEPLFEIGGFELPKHLSLRVLNVPLEARESFLRRWLEKRATTRGLVFVNTRRQAHELYDQLVSWGLIPEVYFSRLSAEERKNFSLRIERVQPDVLIATSAFGMGMDYDFLDWVLFWQPSFSMTDLAQRLGRVARKGQAGVAVILWSQDDFRLLEWSVGRSKKRQRDLWDLHQWFQAVAKGQDAAKGLTDYYRATQEKA